MVTVLVGMFLLGLFIALGTWTLSWSNHVKRELIVKVEFKTKPQATRQQENAVVRKLSSNSEVKSWKFVSKEVALERMKKRYPELTSGPPVQPAARLDRGHADEGRGDLDDDRPSLRPLRAGRGEDRDRQALLEQRAAGRARDRGDLHDRDR